MLSGEIRKSFLDFFEKKGHKIIPSSSLIPDDPSVLFTTAGMQQFKKYYTGEKSPYGNNVASAQKCFRTSDIDSVGDESHLTFFEMLGNFSFGGYFKKKAIEYAYEFITKKLGLKIDYVSIFGGDPSARASSEPQPNSSGQVIPADEESEKIWREIDGNIKIKKAGKEDNFWGPTGNEGPCGPTTEIYINGVEIWNIVFNEYYKNKEGDFKKLETPGVDTGMGLERLAMVVQDKKTIFETDLFAPIMNNFPSDFGDRQKRIIADHARAIIFLIADGVRPSNKEQGYVLRRLMRRMIAQQAFGPSGLLVVGLGNGIDMSKILEEVIKFYKDVYVNLDTKTVIPIFDDEVRKYGQAINKGIKEILKMESVDSPEAFYLYESFGLPYEAIKDIAGIKAKNLTREDFGEEFKKHQEISRAGAEKKFGGHGLKEGIEENQKIIKLHTATHLLQWALQEVLGKEVKQMGSDINPERMRFDFNFSRKLTVEEIKKITDLVNEKIKEKLPVSFKEMSKEEAEKIGALAFFRQKYGETVKVYFIGSEKNPASKEFCAGPHVKNTDEIGEFKILKEEAVGAGLRRIRADVE